MSAEPLVGRRPPTSSLGRLAYPPRSRWVEVFRRFEDFAFAQEPSVHVFRNLDDLAPLMREADLVVSAAGITLYEPCAVGVPTFAVLVVDSLLANARGFAERACGAAITHLKWTDEELAEALKSMRSADVRQKYVHAMRRTVPRDDAELIVQLLLAW